MEQVLTKDISPPLQLAKVESKLVSIPCLSLKQWCHASLQETAESAKEVCCLEWGVCVLVVFVFQECVLPEVRPAGTEAEGSSKVESGHEEVAGAADVGSVAQAAGDIRNSVASADGNNMSSGATEDGGAIDDGDEQGNGAAPMCAKQLLKLQKAAVCRSFTANMKPHYKAKFKSKVRYHPLHHVINPIPPFPCGSNACD